MGRSDTDARTAPWTVALEGRLGAIVSSSTEDTSSHGRDEGYQRASIPGRVVYARDKRDVLETLEVARKHRVPVTPFVVGSSLEGPSCRRRAASPWT